MNLDKQLIKHLENCKRFQHKNKKKHILNKNTCRDTYDYFYINDDPTFCNSHVRVGNRLIEANKYYKDLKKSQKNKIIMLQNGTKNKSKYS